MQDEGKAMPEAETYVVVAPGYWATDDELKHAIARLLSMGCRDLKITAYHVSKDWDMDSFSIRGSVVIKLPDVMVSTKLAERMWKAFDEIEDITDQVMIAHDRATEAA